MFIVCHATLAHQEGHLLAHNQGQALSVASKLDKPIQLLQHMVSSVQVRRFALYNPSHTTQHTLSNKLSHSKLQLLSQQPLVPVVLS